MSGSEADSMRVEAEDPEDPAFVHVCRFSWSRDVSGRLTDLCVQRDRPKTTASSFLEIVLRSMAEP